MGEHGLAVGAAIAFWYFSTGLILLLCGLPRQTHIWSMLGFTALLPVAMYGVYLSGADGSASGAYAAFVSALLVWAWIEASFLFGYITGPRRTPCPPNATGWPRFRYATETVIHHELVILLGAVVVVGLTWNAPNHTASLTFVILMIMRISAKLNIFLGIPYINDELIPEQIGYLKTYFRRRYFNSCFPISFGAGFLGAVVLFQKASEALAAGDSPVSYLLVFTLLVLALLEHVFMIIPFRDTSLWRWASRRKATRVHDD